MKTTIWGEKEEGKLGEKKRQSRPKFLTWLISMNEKDNIKAWGERLGEKTLLSSTGLGQKSKRGH